MLLSAESARRLGRVLSLLPMLTSAVAFSQINSSQATVALTATLTESLTIAATPNAITFSLAPGAAATGSQPVAITTTWVLAPGRASVHLYAWFTTPSAALTDGGSPANTIASSLVLGQVTTGTPSSFTPFSDSNTLGAASGGLALFTQSITSANRSSNRADNLNLKIDLTSLPQLPAGTYNGTLTLQAQAL